MVEDWVKPCMKTFTTWRNHPVLGLGRATTRLGQEGGVGRSGIKKGGRRDGGGGRDQYSGRLHTGLSLPVSSGARNSPWSVLDSYYSPCSWTSIISISWDLVKNEQPGPHPDLLNQIHIKGADLCIRQRKLQGRLWGPTHMCFATRGVCEPEMQEFRDSKVRF